MIASGNVNFTKILWTYFETSELAAKSFWSRLQKYEIILERPNLSKLANGEKSQKTSE